MENKTIKQYLQENIEDIIRLRNEGKYYKEIAEIYGVYKSAVGEVLRENGYWSRPKLTDNSIKEIIQKYQDGMASNKIAALYHKTPQAIIDILRENNIKIEGSAIRAKKYTLDEHYFDVINTSEKAYLIGLIITDGCVGHNRLEITLQEEDKHILEHMNSLLNSNRPLHYIDFHAKGKTQFKNQYQLTIVNKYFVESLKNLGITERKSLTVEYPNCITNDLFPAFLRGVIDGDGHLSKKHNVVEIAGTIMLMTEIQKKLAERGIKSSIYHKKQCKEVTVILSLSNLKDTKALLDMIYEDSTIHLNRKYQIYLDRYVNQIA